jgi:hypothetical protein
MSPEKNQLLHPPDDGPGTTMSLRLRASLDAALPSVALATRTWRRPTVPVSPVDPPNDAVLFEDPADSAKKYYLPRYRLAEEKVSGQTRYRMALESKGTGWTLTIVFEKFPAPELGTSARNAQELPHEPEFILVHRLFLGETPAGTKELAFRDVVRVEGGLQATLLLESLDERDQVYRALTEAMYATNLIVRRTVRLAVPVPLPNSGAHILSAGTIVLQPKQGLDLAAGSASEGTPHIRWTSEKKISPLGSVQLGLIGKVDFEQVGFRQLGATRHTSGELSSASEWDAGSVLNITPLWNPGGKGGVYDKNSLGVWYTGSAWSIFHQDMQAMVPGAAFVVTNSKQRSEVFVHKAQPVLPQWTVWASLGAPAGGFLNAPSTISRNPQVCNVYVRGGEGALWQLAFFDGRWHSWVKHDGILLAEPAVGSLNPNHEHVFGQGTDGQLFQKWWTSDAGWQAWSPLGAPAPGFVGRPGTVSRSPQVWNVYVRGRDNALWQLPFHGRRRHFWSRHDDGGVLASAPAAGSMNPNHEHVFVRGTDGQVWVKWWLQGSGWSAWAALGAPPGGFVGGPAISDDAATCDLFVRGRDNALWQKSYRSGVWGAWERHNDGGVLAEDPAVASMRADHLQVFVRGTDGRVWQKSWGTRSVAGGNISGNTTIINHPLLNGNRKALCQVTQNWNPGGGGGTYNPKHIGIYLAGDRWAIFNQDGSAMPVGAAFNVRIAVANRSFVHRVAPDNLHGHVTIIRRPELDGKPELMLLITPNWNPVGPGEISAQVGVYDDHPIGVYYTGQNWAIYNQDIAAMPAGAAFNVEIVDAPEAFVHEARPETNTGNYTLIDPASAGAVARNQVISVRLGDESLAKLLVVDCTELLSLRWITFSAAPLYKEEPFRLDLSRLRDSFIFPPNLYPYIFRGIEDVPGGRPGLVRRTVEWNGAQHPYYQEEAQRRLFYYLPDAFKIARRAAPVRAPEMAINVSSPDGSLERTMGSLSYVAVPVTDAARLESARKRLQAHVPDSGGEAELELLPASKLSFKLGLPRPGGTAVSFTEQKDALVNMTKLRHSIELPIEALQAVFEGVFSSSSLVFQGQIDVTLSERDPIPPIPFEARMNDLAGDPLECTLRRQDSGMEASLRNIIESPVRIREMKVTVRSGNRTSSARMEGLVLPLDLAAGQRVAHVLIPDKPFEPTDETEAHFDLREVEVLPDREAIWNAILETTVQPEYVRKVGVKTVVELFRGPEPRVSLVRVNLQRGGGAVVSVDLTEQQLEAEASLRAPLRDYVMGKADPGIFQYQVLTVRGGIRTPASAWKEASTNLIITTEDLE